MEDVGNKIRISIFTPAYNRAHTLYRLYKSLSKQTFPDFEWIVVDDGSTDNTEEVVGRIIEEANGRFPIRYIKTENGGKHRAINRGIPHVRGELTFIVDSDDWLPEDSLSLINEVENSIVDKRTFGGVCGVKYYDNNLDVGESFQGDYLDITTIERKKHGIKGDKAEVFYTAVLKKYPFPEIEGEMFVTEAVVWNRIANDGYKLRFFNKRIYCCEYLEDGLSAQGNALYARNPKQWALYINQEYSFGAASKKETEIQVYIYYLNLKEKIRKREMIELLGLGKKFFQAALFKQTVIDVLRWFLHRGKTIRKTVRRKK